MPVQLIVSDLDGTLFKLDHSGTISGENLLAVRDAQERGIPFFVCTGRQVSDTCARVYRYEELKDVGIAGMNGSSIIRGRDGVPVYNRRLTEAEWRGCVEIIRKYPVRWVMSGSIFRNGVLWTEYPTENEMLAADIGCFESCFTAPDDGAQWDVGINKIHCRSSAWDPNLDLLRAELQAAFPGLEIRSSWNDNLEVAPSGCHKGAVIRRLGELFGVPVENIMVLGDNENDIPMLEAAGLSVCMSNGSDGAKAASDYVMDNSDCCGVARAIRRFALGEE